MTIKLSKFEFHKERNKKKTQSGIMSSKLLKPHIKMNFGFWKITIHQQNWNELKNQYKAQYRRSPLLKQNIDMSKSSCLEEKNNSKNQQQSLLPCHIVVISGNQIEAISGNQIETISISGNQIEDPVT